MTNTTRHSLIVRLKDPSDQTAWEQFVDIYGPLIYWFGRHKGLQDADATDMMQDVFRQVSGAIKKFDYDPEVGKFRSWLFVIARHTASKIYKKAERQPRGTGDSGVERMLNEVPGKDEEIWEKEYRQHLFEWACENIKNEFADTTWKAFWATSVDGQPASEVAAHVGISVGAVYIAKTRVIKRLKQKIATVDQSLDP